jgi:hypothetical protein
MDFNGINKNKKEMMPSFCKLKRPLCFDCFGRQSEYLNMKHHLGNSNLVGYRIGGAYRCGPILKA